MCLVSRHCISMAITDKSISLRRLIFKLLAQRCGGPRSSEQFALEEVDELKVIGFDARVR